VTSRQGLGKAVSWATSPARQKRRLFLIFFLDKKPARVIFTVDETRVLVTSKSTGFYPNPRFVFSQIGIFDADNEKKDIFVLSSICGIKLSLLSNNKVPFRDEGRKEAMRF
jgi:hypothetical protein